jgi:hypothetical protein
MQGIGCSLGQSTRDVSAWFARPTFPHPPRPSMKNSGGIAHLLRVTIAFGTHDARRRLRVGAALAAVGALGAMNSATFAELTTLRIQDFAIAPQTGLATGNTDNSWYMARVNFMADEPGGGNRFFVNDLNGPLYILDKNTKQFTSYLNFNGRDGLPGLFNEFVYDAGYANGLITFQFDPNYRNNGKFYTVHMEDPAAESRGPFGPNNSSVPGLNTAGYTTTSAVTTPGGSFRQTVLIEWTDTNINNTAFEGTARELLRVNMSGRIHPMGDLIFNPTAEPGEPDWRVMYISVGDGGAGESGNTAARRTPQLLNTLGGKVLRIVPDLGMADATKYSTSPNNRYLIPKDNPFTDVVDPGGTNGAVRDEIWTLGHRNVHRLSWDVDPANPDPNTNNHLIVNEIGLHTWEEVNIVTKGLNYGYSEREGPQALGTDNEADDPPPNPDLITKNLICTGSGFTSCSNSGTLTPTYPVVAYGHDFADSTYIGDSISSGYVYRGSKIPQLYGKYLFGEITTGQIFYADYEKMLAADDGDPDTMAEIHSLHILWDNPNDAPDQGEQLYTTSTVSGVLGPMFPIIERTYEFRGGTDPNLPGAAEVTGGNGRADIRIQIDEDGELYILSKSDGMIRQIVGPARIPGDYDHDGDVDATDYGVWKGAFGTTVPVAGLWADGNEDGMVDGADYVVWRNAFTGPGAGASLSSVPEPASAVLAAGMIFLLSIRRLGAQRKFRR